MFSWPDPGTRVTLRYRRPQGSVPPLTDAVGHLLAVDPVVRVRTKSGAVVEVGPDDVVALRVLTDAPVRTSDIRALERAAAAASPGAEEAWLQGWLLRAGNGVDVAVPLDVSASPGAVPAIAAWYQRRGLAGRLCVPDRLLALPPGRDAQYTERVLVRDVPAAASGEPGPGGARWVGVSAGGDDESVTAACEELATRAAAGGANRTYLVVPGDAAAAVAGALGFREHHRRRYFAARSPGWDTV
ncbi:GCN5 family acetyltransferase [Mycobacterium malmoense]|uniref:GNAT family N-acetyltransferase, cg3035/Rv0428c family n=1 Tax=Mycobacterium malmoense TaxID=1780 RepID=UPI00080BFF61|nr:GCN5 family acetyltransferase [Mycobacterium malmoense]OCB29841.1 GCN5 family acetyltransferase [Mycobacterium malmoense]